MMTLNPQGMPVKVYLKENGAFNKDGSDGPLLMFLIKCKRTFFGPYYAYTPAQISIEMLNDGLADIGYEIRKKP